MVLNVRLIGFKERFFAMMLLFPMTVLAQKLKTESFDAASKRWRFETFPVNIKSSPEATTNISFTAADTSFTLYLSGSGMGTSTVDMGSELIFVLENDSMVVAKSPAIQGIDFENLTSRYRHRYEISLNGVRALSRHPIKTIRKFSVGGVDIIPIEKKIAVKVTDVSRQLVTKLNEKKLLPDNTTIIPPGFPGGRDVFTRFLNRNLKQLSGLQSGERKSVVALLRVSPDGIVNDVQLNTSLDTSFNNELVRLFQRMPKWKPALQNGRPVAYNLSLPLTIVRSNDLLRIEL
jgi:hypothetical protein